MPIDASLITNAMANWQQPADPLAQVAKIQALKNGITQAQIQQQNLQSGAIDIQQKQRQIADQQALDAALSGGITRDPATGAVSYDQNKVLSSLPGHMLPGVSKTFNDMNEASAKLQTAQLAAANAKTEAVGSALLGVKDASYAPEALNAAIQHLVGSKVLTAQEAMAAIQQTGGANATPQTIQAFVDPALNTPGVQKMINERATAKATQERATAATTTAATGATKAAAELPGIKADAAQKVRADDATALEAAFRQGGPDAFNTALAALPPDRAQVFKGVQNLQDIRNAGLTPAQATTAAQADTRATQQKAYEDAQTRIANARLGVEKQRLANETAVQGVFSGMPAADRGRAETAYSKDTKDYTDKISTARGLQDLITQAQNGNMAAPALIPIDELRGFVNRVNAAELRSVGVNAGSVLDQVQGYIDGKLKGQPIPPALLRDMAAVSKGQEIVAKRTYLGRLAANKAAFGASPPPIDISGIYGDSPGAGAPAPAAVNPYR